MEVDDDDGVVMDTLMTQTSCRRPFVERVLRGSVALSLISGGTAQTTQVVRSSVMPALIPGCDAQAPACIECFGAVYRMMVMISAIAVFLLGMMAQRLRERQCEAPDVDDPVCQSSGASSSQSNARGKAKSRAKVKAQLATRSTTLPSPRPKAKSKAMPKHSVLARAAATQRWLEPEMEAEPLQPVTEEPSGCPVCGGPMVFRSARRGGVFRSCARWPECEGTRRPHDM